MPNVAASEDAGSSNLDPLSFSNAWGARMSLVDNQKGIVLIVDDEPMAADLLYVHLDKAGFDVLVAQDGDEAISQTEAAQPDVILMDVMLPGIDGFETCRRLKENEATREIPVIFMTSLSERADKIRGFEVGGVDYVTKPIESQEVIARVTTHFTIHDLQRELNQENFLLQQEIAERRQAEERLRQSEARNRALLDAIPDVICRLTNDGQFLDCRDGPSEDLSVPSEQHIGKNVSDVLSTEVAELFLDHIHKTLASGAIQVFEYQLETPVGVQQYETRLVNSGLNEVLGIVRNITERKHAENQALHNERLVTLGKLAATLAHEINNPLQAIQSHLDLALTYSLDSEKREKHLRIIHRQIERLHNLSQAILDLASPKPMPRQQVFVAKLIEQVLDLANRQLMQNNLEVVTDIDDTLSVLAIPTHLTQVFLNLVLNAIDSTSGNGQLSINAYQEDAQVIISFANNGPAISSAALPYVFEPFFTTKTEGKGLGLWISHNLIQQQEGTMTVANLTNDKGVIFTIKLPTFSP